MAATFNAFNILESGAAPPISKSKKKKNKKQGGATTAAAAAPAEPVQPAFVDPEFEELARLEDKPRPPDHEEFQPARRRKDKPATGTPPAAPQDAPAASKPAPAAAADAPFAAYPADQGTSAGTEVFITVDEAYEQVEEAARYAAGLPDRASLWQQWQQQFAEIEVGRGVRYHGPGGRLVDFREMLLASRALELSVQSCLAAPIPADHAAHLQEVLAQCLAPDAPPNAAAALSAAVQHLASSLPAMGRLDLLQAAQGSVAAVVGSLKVPIQQPGGQETAAQQSARLAHHILQLQEEAAAGGSKKVQPQDLLQEAAELSLQRVLLHADNDTSSPATSHAVQSLISSLSQASNQVSGYGNSGASRQALKQQEMQLTMDAQELHGQVAALEAQLRSLKFRHAEKLQQLQMVQTQLKMAQPSAAHKPPHAPQSGPDPAAVRRATDAARSLEALLAASQQGGGGIGGTSDGAAEDYLAALEAVLEARKKQLKEAAERVRGWREHLARAERQAAKLAALNADKDTIEGNRKAMRDAQQTLMATVHAATEVFSAAQAVFASFGRARGVIGDPAALPKLGQCTILQNQITDAWDDVRKAASGEQVAAPAPAGENGITHAKLEMDDAHLDERLNVLRAMEAEKDAEIAALNGSADPSAAPQQPPTPNGVAGTGHGPKSAEPGAAGKGRNRNRGRSNRSNGNSNGRQPGDGAPVQA